MRKIKPLGFTVIELLVVVSVIGLLSSLALVAAKNARKDAELKSVMQFSSSIQHALGAYALGMWRFEETTIEFQDNGAKDSSNNGIDLHWTTGEKGSIISAGVFGKAASFLSSAGGAGLYALSEKLIAKGNAITAEFWVYTASVASYKNIFETDYFYCEILTPLSLKCDIHDDSGGSATLTKAIKANEWFHVALAYDGNGVAKVFINAQENSLTGTLSSPAAKDNSVWISYGGSVSGSFYMDEVRIYDSNMSLSEAKEHYVQGLFKIGLKEYNDKI